MNRAADKNNKLDFKQRMRSIAKQQERTVWRPENMKTAVTLEEYANVIEEARKSNSVVVVNFHATWCKVSKCS
jgi:thiol:disulfide interchange protein